MKSIPFTENDIRPMNLEKECELCVAIDVGRLLTKRKFFLDVMCPACSGNKSTYLFQKNLFEYVICNDCKTMYVNPRPPKKVLEWFYKGSKTYEYWNKYIFPSSEQSRKEKIFVPRVDKILELSRKYLSNPDSVLEVGCGFGTFCEELISRKKFKRVVGVETTPDLAQTCRLKGIEVIEQPIETVVLDSDEKFDIIASYEVIEHLFSPNEFLNKLFGCIKKGGLLILSCPNGNGFDINMLGPLSGSVDHEHLNYFNPDSLSLLLKKCGFNPLEVYTPGVLDAELVRNKILSNEFNISNNPFLQNVLIDKWDELGVEFQSFLSRNRLSSHMMVVAQKV